MAGLEEEFGVSPATARRDLMLLERQDKVRRTHGGAVLPGFAQHEDSFQQRLGEAVEAKKRLARAASALLELDETLFVDSSTTAYYAVQRMLADVSNFTCLSNLVPIMELFSTSDSAGVSMMGLGGIFRPLTLSFVGPCTVRMIESYLADRAFLSVKGMTPQGHLTEPNPLEAEIKRTMIRQAEKPMALVDGRKFEQRGSSVIAHASEVSLVITANACRSYVETLEDLEVAVQCV